MARALSNDLRSRVLKASTDGLSARQAAARLGLVYRVRSVGSHAEGTGGQLHGLGPAQPAGGKGGAAAIRLKLRSTLPVIKRLFIPPVRKRGSAMWLTF